MSNPETPPLKCSGNCSLLNWANIKSVGVKPSAMEWRPQNLNQHSGGKTDEKQISCLKFDLRFGLGRAGGNRVWAVFKRMFPRVVCVQIRLGHNIL